MEVDDAPAGQIVHAGGTVLCQVGGQIVGAFAPLLCGILQVYEVLQAVVIVTTRRSWRAVGTLSKLGRGSGVWGPEELEGFLLNLALLILVLGVVLWTITRSRAVPQPQKEFPGSTTEGPEPTAPPLAPDPPPPAIDPDTSLYLPVDFEAAAVYEALTLGVLRRMCRERHINSSGRKAVVVDALVRSVPGRVGPVQRDTPATRKQMARIEALVRRYNLPAHSDVYRTAAEAAGWIQRYAMYR